MWRYLPACVFALTASAQTPLTLEDSLSTALAKHPLIEAARNRIVTSEGVRRQAGLGLNPRFTFQTENVRFSDSPPFQYWNATDTFALLAQTFETAGKRQRRVATATVALQHTELELELLSRQIADRVKRAYWAAGGSMRIHELLLQSAESFLRTVEYHEVRVREGAMAEADLLRVRLESERLALAANGALLVAERARIALYREMGQTDIAPAVRYDALEAADGESPKVDYEAALEQRTEMKLARAGLELAEANLRLQQSNARPNIDGIMGYKRTSGLNTLVAGLQFDLPYRNRNQGNIAAATADIATGRAELSAVSALIKAEVAAAAKDYEIRRRQITETLRPMLQQAKESSEIAAAAYREGGWDLLRLLDAERLRIETEVLYYQALTEYRQSIAALETSMGVAP
jgi:cobalt-zinc-cadmium efflux system outer membrane protein